MPDKTSDAIAPGTKLRHKSLGECEFVRNDETNWVVRHIESGVHWKLPGSSASQSFKILPVDGVSRAVNSGEAPAQADRHVGTRLRHSTLGECVVVRTEGVDWIIRPVNSSSLFRCSPPARRFLTEIREPETPEAQIAIPPKDSDGDAVSFKPASFGFGERSPQTEVPSKPPSRERPLTAEAEPVQQSSAENRVEIGPAADPMLNRRQLKRAFESLRNGLPPEAGMIERFSIGTEQTVPLLDRMLDSVHLDGGNACVIRGAYGQGKTFSLEVLKERALNAGYLVASTEIDAYENKIEKPHHIYRALMSSLQIPASQVGGAAGLVARTVEYLREKFPAWYHSGSAEQAELVHQHLLKETQCGPLAWLLSDPSISEKASLIGLLACEPGIQVGQARRTHLLPSQPWHWPAFSAGTQGDFASYVLCGLGRLSRLLDSRGLLILLDEMEKWQALDWKAQCRAGNMFGGLIWGATAEAGHRTCSSRERFHRSPYNIWEGCHHDKVLEHSGRCGGYPFTTADRCFLGVAVAMTPRGTDSPEADWDHYGVLEVIDLPSFNVGLLKDYVNRLVPLYQQAYSLSGQLPNDFVQNVLRRWQLVGDESARTASRAVIESLDEWRDQQPLPM
jgi:hypothetical protein